MDAAIPTGTRSLRTRHILLVEDEPVTAMVERKTLESAGYEVTLAATGEAAVSLVDDGAAIDLILMDIDLGNGIDGTEAARRILDRCDLPIVFLSSHTEPDVVRLTEQITSYGYIVKNTGNTVLLASLRMAFQLREAHEQLERANQENARNSAYLNTIVDADPVGYVVLSSDGYVRDVNPAYRKITGLEREDLIGRHISEIDAIDDPDSARRRMELIHAGDIVQFLTEHRTRDGGTVPLEVTVHPIELDGETRVISFCRDLSEIQSARSSVEQNEQLQASLFEQVPGAIYQFQYFPDGSSRIPMASQNISLVFDVTPEMVRHDATAALTRIHPDDYHEVIRTIEQSRDLLEDWTIDFRVILPSRGERWLRGRARPERRSDGSTLWHGFIIDVTDEKEASLKLEDQSRRLQSVIDGTNVGTWEWNVQTGETRFNDRWAEIIGMTLPELMPVSIETWEHFTHPDDLKRSEKTLQAHFRGETEFYECTARMRHRDGHWVWVLDTGKVSTWSADGEPEWVFGTHQDVSESIRYQERLRESEANLRTFFDASQDMLLVLDDRLDVLAVNETAVKRLGFSREELKGTPLLARYPEAHREDVARFLMRPDAAGRTVCLAPVQARDGQRISAETAIVPLSWSGSSARAVVVRDISDLEFSNEKYARMVNSNPAMIGLSDADSGELLEVNDAFVQVLEFDREYAIGRHGGELLGLDRATRDQIRAEMGERGSFAQREATIYARSGEPVAALISGSRIELQDRRCFLLIAIDIRKRKQAEEQLQRAMHGNETLLREMNHRVKNNLAMVTSLVRLKNEDLGDGVDLSDLESRIQAITSLHLELQHTEAFDRVALEPYLLRVVENVFAGASGRVDARVTADSCCLPTAHATTIGLIVNELATNAVKHAFPAGVGGQFVVTGLLSGRALELTVENDGEPISEHVSLESAGSMGMQLVSALVAQLNGSITLERRPNTRFLISIPDIELE